MCGDVVSMTPSAGLVSLAIHTFSGNGIVATLSGFFTSSSGGWSSLGRFWAVGDEGSLDALRFTAAIMEHASENWQLPRRRCFIKW